MQQINVPGSFPKMRPYPDAINRLAFFFSQNMLEKIKQVVYDLPDLPLCKHFDFPTYISIVKLSHGKCGNHETKAEANVLCDRRRMQQIFKRKILSFFFGQSS